MNRLVLVLIGIVILCVAYAQPYRPAIVVGDSMAPTFSPNQVLVANRNFSTLERGDIVVFHRNGASYVKRVAFIEGDEITQYQWQDEWEIPSHGVRRNFFEREGVPRRTITVPKGSVYVIGDNVNASVDSRHFGAIPISEIDAVVPPTDEDGPQPRFAGIQLGHHLAALR